MGWREALRLRPKIESAVSKVFKLPDLSITEDIDLTGRSGNGERLTAGVRQLAAGDEGLVRSFLEESKENWGPFKNALRTVLDKPGELEYALSAWNLKSPQQARQYNDLHRLYFGCFHGEEMIGGVICAVQLNQGRIEIGGIAGKGQRSRGFGSSAIPAILSELAKFQPYQAKIQKVLSETQLENAPARKVLERCGFSEVKRDEMNILYEMPFEKIAAGRK